MWLEALGVVGGNKRIRLLFYVVSTHEFTSHTHEFTSRTHEVTRWGDSTTDYRLKTTVGMSDVSDTGGHPLTTYPIRRTYLMGVEGNNCESDGGLEVAQTRVRTVADRTRLGLVAFRMRFRTRLRSVTWLNFKMRSTYLARLARMVILIREPTLMLRANVLKLLPKLAQEFTQRFHLRIVDRYTHTIN